MKFFTAIAIFSNYNKILYFIIINRYLYKKLNKYYNIYRNNKIKQQNKMNFKKIEAT